MPQTSPERRARWPGGEPQACAYLEAQGYWLNIDPDQPNAWCWVAPQPSSAGFDGAPGDSPDADHDREWDAVCYLQEEWDYGGIVQDVTVAE